MRRIAVLLTVFNRKNKTINCLRNLYHQALPTDTRIDVYITDDGCTDGTPQEIKNEFPKVTIIQGDGCLFWNRGMIEAWEEASKSDPDYYLWLNDDTFIFDNAIKRILDSAKVYPDAIIVGTCRSSCNTEVITYGARNKHMKLINPCCSKKEKAYTFNGNIVLISKKVYERLGTMDKMFHHSLGDFDYGLRATKQNIPIIVADGILAICDTHEFIAKWCNPKFPFSERWRHFWSPTGANPIEFFKFRLRHNGLVAACVTFCSNFLHVICPQLWVNMHR